MFVLDISTSGESLSEMIFNPSQIIDPPPFPPQTMPTWDSIQKSRQVVRTMDESSIHVSPSGDMSNPARIRGTATKASLTLSSDSSSSELSALSHATSSDNGELEQQAVIDAPESALVMSAATGRDKVVPSLTMVSATPLNIVPKARPKHNANETTDTTTKAVSSRSTIDQKIRSTPLCNGIHGGEQADPQSSHDVREEEGNSAVYHQTFVPYNSVGNPDQPAPQTQPNSSDSSPSLSSLSSLPMSPRRPGYHDFHPWTHNRNTDMAAGLLCEGDIEATQPPRTSTRSKEPSVSLTSAPLPFSATSVSASRPKPSLVSLPLQYWRSRSNTQPASHRADSSALFTSSFTPSYLSNTFSKKKKTVIPTIVIHPDEDDGEPPRVLSQKDIDYLSTMPPPPLRPLTQPWDDIQEDDGYEDEDDLEYGSNNYHAHHRQVYREGGMEMANTTGVGTNDQGLDPYALDVPIDLEIDLQEFTRQQHVHRQV